MIGSEMENQPYDYRQCGLDHVYLVNGFERADTKYGDSIRVHDIDGLHRAIGMHLIEQKRPLTGLEVRFTRHELDRSQRGLGDLSRDGRRVKSRSTVLLNGSCGCSTRTTRSLLVARRSGRLSSRWLC